MGKRVRCVSGAEYGLNQFVDNGDGTISDEATDLMWMQAGSAEGMDWEAALAYAQSQNEVNYLGYNDWRLPNVKELQSIVDYSYAPDAQDAAYDGPALDPMFSVSEITNEISVADYPYERGLYLVSKIDIVSISPNWIRSGAFLCLLCSTVSSLVF